MKGKNLSARTVLKILASNVVKRGRKKYIIYNVLLQSVKESMTGRTCFMILKDNITFVLSV